MGDSIDKSTRMFVFQDMRPDVDHFYNTSQNDGRYRSREGTVGGSLYCDWFGDLALRRVATSASHSIARYTEGGLPTVARSETHGSRMIG